jgi:uncharacterized repeat protein (TIGR04138 family)
MPDDFFQQVEQLAEQDGRYGREAYFFVFAALDHTVRALNRAEEPEIIGNVTGQELAWGIADYTREQYGPMARSVLSYWGLNATLDFGHIVFSLIDAGLMRQTENDSLKDFANVYDFDEVFDSKRIQNELKIPIEQI